MKTLKCKPSAQFAYNYTINVSSKCGSSVFEGRHNAIDLRRSAHPSSIFEGRHIDLRRSTHRSSKAETSRQPNIAPTFRQFVTPYLLYLKFCVVYTYSIYITKVHTPIHQVVYRIRQWPHTALVASEASLMYELAVTILWYNYI